MRRNLTRNGPRLARAAVRFVSYPKSGRTWFRVLWSAYACALREIPFTLDPDPSVAFTHDLWEHRVAAGRLARLTGYHLVPASALRRPVVWLVRDPRDVMVSLFFQLGRRQRTRYTPPSPGALLRHERFGMPLLVGVIDAWWRAFGAHAARVRYEDARADPEGVMRGFLERVGASPIDEAAFQQALAFASFDAMHARERLGGGPEPLRAGDVADPSSYKTRAGVVGGWRDHLDADDARFCLGWMARLPPALGYPPFGPDP